MSLNKYSFDFMWQHTVVKSHCCLNGKTSFHGVLFNTSLEKPFLFCCHFQWQFHYGSALHIFKSD